MHMRRLLPSLTIGAVLVALLAAPAAADQAGAIVPADSAPPTEVTVSGTVRVVPAEHRPVHAVLGEPVPEPELHSPGSVTLHTDEGAIVDLRGAESGELATGRRVDVLVRVPEPLRTAVADRVRAERATLDEARLGELVADAAEARDTALTVVDIRSAPPVRAAVAPAEHLLDVIFYNRSGSGVATPSQATVDTVIARMSEYWKSESNGQISRIHRPLAMKSQTVGWDICNPYEAWNQAAAAFGRAESYYWSNSANRHLVVLVPAEVCGGGGLGTLGDRIHQGGEVHAEVPVSSPVDWDQVLFHEFGHNISLDHSNARSCMPPAVDSAVSATTGQPTNSACYDEEYGDVYDVMGAGFSLYGGNGQLLASTTRNITTLNVTHRTTLSAFPSGALRTITSAGGGVQTVTLQAGTATSGVRGVQVTDPVNGEKLYVEYRAGLGRDAQSLYARWPAATGEDAYGPGVRILRQYQGGCATWCWFGSSLALQQHSPTGPRMHFGAGDQLRTHTGGVTIRVVSVSASAAQVQVSFVPLTPPTVDRVAGANRYGTAVAVSRAAFGAGTVPTVYLATGANYPDALAAAPAAARNGGPLLLVPTKASSVSSELLDRIRQLAPKRVVIVGGPLAVPAAVVAAIRPALPSGARVDRIEGTNRYDTGRRIVADAFPRADRVYIATGRNYPDALSAAAAGGGQAPVVLVNGTANALDTATRSLLSTLAPREVVIVGGPLAVSTRIEIQLSTLFDVTRVAGGNRYETSAAINQEAFGAAPIPRQFWATGGGFPDALTGAVLASVNSAPLYVVKRTCVPAEVLAAVAGGETKRVTLLGGELALNAQVAALRSC